MKTINLRCEFLTDPLGIDALIPRLRESRGHTNCLK
jgi:hypothetical protein